MSKVGPEACRIRVGISSTCEAAFVLRRSSLDGRFLWSCVCVVHGAVEAKERVERQAIHEAQDCSRGGAEACRHHGTCSRYL